MENTPHPGADTLVRATAFDGLVRAFAIESTGVVDELARRHETEPAVTAAIGRLATGTLTFGAMLKEPAHTVTVRLQGDGPAGTLLATADGTGRVRGLVANPAPGIEQVRAGKLNVSGAVGTTGRLTVTRELGLRHPYSSTVQIVSGEVGEDLAYFLAHSDQVPSAVGIGVFVRADGSVEAAGGYVVQILPGLDEDDAATIEAEIRSLPHPTTLLRGGDTPDDILARIFPDGVQVLDRIPVRFHCPCSRERVERALILLGRQALEEMRDDRTRRQEGTEAVCRFCTAEYHLSDAELSALIEQAAA